MNTQRFEVVCDEGQLSMIVDLLRYENASLKERVRVLEKQQETSAAKLREAEKLLETMQAIIDMQNAELFSHKQKSLD